MSYIETIYLKRHEYFLNFANSFFTKEFWDQILQDHNPSCGFLSAFYTMVQARCDTSKEETSKIVFNSLIQTSFKSNKDFVSNLININNNLSYFFNVTNIDLSSPIEFAKIRNKVINDLNERTKF